MNAAQTLPLDFNATAYFVDRNVTEGRGDRPAYLYAERWLRYRDVADLVNRTGNALLSLGVW